MFCINNFSTYLKKMAPKWIFLLKTMTKEVSNAWKRCIRAMTWMSNVILGAPVLRTGALLWLWGVISVSFEGFPVSMILHCLACVIGILRSWSYEVWSAWFSEHPSVIRSIGADHTQDGQLWSRSKLVICVRIRFCHCVHQADLMSEMHHSW